MKKINEMSTEVINIDDMVKSIPIECSWCSKIYHIKNWQLQKGQKSSISHGMCSTCEEKHKKELEVLI